MKGIKIQSTHQAEVTVKYLLEAETLTPEVKADMEKELDLSVRSAVAETNVVDDSGCDSVEIVSIEHDSAFSSISLSGRSLEDVTSAAKAITEWAQGTGFLEPTNI